MKRKNDTGGRPPYKPNERDRVQVKTLAAMGVPYLDIAKVMQISAPTVRKYFEAELEAGTIEANAKVAQSLFKQATNEKKPNVTAAIFWLKARAGWRDGREHGGGDDDPPGKKAAAAAAARTAADGTEWDGLLPKSPTLQ